MVDDSSDKYDRLQLQVNEQTRWIFDLKHHTLDVKPQASKQAPDSLDKP